MSKKTDPKKVVKTPGNKKQIEKEQEPEIE